jgi:hypothetical protein
MDGQVGLCAVALQHWREVPQRMAPNLTYTTVVVRLGARPALTGHNIRDGNNTSTKESGRREQTLNRWQSAIDTMDDMMNDKATLNEFFAKAAQPHRSEGTANSLLNVSEDRYVTAPEGSL